MTTRSGRRIVPPLPQEALTLDERAQLVQSRTEEMNAASMREVTPNPDVDETLSSTTEGGSWTVPEDEVTSVLNLLKSIPGTQSMCEDDSDDVGENIQGDTSLVPTPIQPSSPGVSADIAISQTPPNSPPPLFLSEDDATPTSIPFESNPGYVRPSPSLSSQSLTIDEIRTWITTLLGEEAQQLASFSRRSWGTAYQSVAEVQFVLEVGQRFRMSANFARHHISSGRFTGRGNEDVAIEFQLLGSLLNGQSMGTWTNKLTFFFSVYKFLMQTEGVAEESLGRELYEIRQAMVSWGVIQRTSNSFLPNADPRASYLITPVHTMIRRYRRPT